MALTWSQMAYYIIVCVTTTHFEPDQVFFVLYLCISYVLFVYIFTRLFNDFISMNFLIAVFFPVSPFIPMSSFLNLGDFCQPLYSLHPPRFLFWPKFASLSIYSALPFLLFFFFNWDSLHARLNSHYKAWSYKKKHKKDYRLQKICLEKTYS